MFVCLWRCVFVFGCFLIYLLLCCFVLLFLSLCLCVFDFHVFVCLFVCLGVCLSVCLFPRPCLLLEGLTWWSIAWGGTCGFVLPPAISLHAFHRKKSQSPVCIVHLHHKTRAIPKMRTPLRVFGSVLAVQREEQYQQCRSMWQCVEVSRVLQSPAGHLKQISLWLYFERGPASGTFWPASSQWCQ